MSRKVTNTIELIWIFKSVSRISYVVTAVALRRQESCNMNFHVAKLSIGGSADACGMKNQ